MELLKAENLSFKYPASAENTLDGLSFSVSKGDYIAVCGSTGSGKTTLLRQLKPELAPLGLRSGDIMYKGKSLSDVSQRESASEIGYIMQRPEQQIVTDRVWHELAFGLENLGVPAGSIRRRVAEMASYFGVEDWFERSTDQLSGGQKQLLNLAAVMVMNPELLILDEPTAQLDPIAASEFLATVRKLNRELSLTVIIAEHRLEEVIPSCDALLVLDGGKKMIFDKPENAVPVLGGIPEAAAALPSAARVFLALDSGDKSGASCPFSVREGREYIQNGFDNSVRSLEHKKPAPSGKEALSMKKCRFRYSRELPDVLCGLDLTVFEGELFFILGGNGSGKTTALGAAAGLLRCTSGTIKVFGKKLSEYKGQSLYNDCLSMLPQDAQTAFLRPTVREELADTGEYPTLYDFSGLLDSHPYDLSGGEQQLLALTKALSARPRLLLLDEPTKGLDAGWKNRIASILQSLKQNGVAVVVVTHDVEFAAQTADRCALFFRGEITCVGEPESFFSENSFYTTAASRMSRGFFDGAVTTADVIELCALNGKRRA